MFVFRLELVGGPPGPVQYAVTGVGAGGALTVIVGVMLIPWAVGGATW